SPIGFGQFFTNTTAIPGLFSFGTNFLGSDFFTSAWGVAVNTNTLSPTSTIVQVVFYPTNLNDPEASIDVRFSSGFGGPSVGPSFVSVAFRSTEFDIATQTQSSNAVYLVDALGTVTNVFLARNQAVNTRRPSTYEITRQEPFVFTTGLPGNGVFTPTLLWNPNYQNRAVSNLYAAYAAQVDLLSSSPSGSIPYDVTNMPGRIEILGDQVNLDASRIRAESALVIRANQNLVSNHLAQIDAPLVSFDVRSTQPVLLITNLAPPTVKRFSGTLRAWSGTWQNTDTGGSTNVPTRSIFFHVLILDSQLQSIQTVAVSDFAARATNVVLQDTLNITRSFAVEGNSFYLTGGLLLPFGSGLGNSNVINVRNFTNDGFIS